ncbi:hypothetical protein ANO14919_096560 [Xylariales sp. No.14919]|nr:hypothetical protein ANO14919_096560 [Xylariales sp. No.14919]
MPDATSIGGTAIPSFVNHLLASNVRSLPSANVELALRHFVSLSE